MAETKDWQYICIGCGKVIMAGADFAESCLGCGGSRWLCHWLNKFRGKDSQGDKTMASQPSNSIVTTQNQMTPLNCTDGKGDKPILGQVQDGKRPGGNHRAVPDDMIKELASQGLGCKAIARKLLDDKGIVISPSTINRRLQGDLI